jgi:hypothetical protein
MIHQIICVKSGYMCSGDLHKLHKPGLGVGGIIGWPGATIPLLTACIPDAILVSIASWPGNLIRGTKLRRQEIQPCPGLR